MLTNVPQKGRKTVYSLFGDWFLYVLIIYAVLLIAYHIVLPFRAKTK